MLLVASRIDAVGEGGRLIRLREFCAKRGLPLHEISSVTGEGLEELKAAVWARLEQIPKSGERESG
jgi:Fe2+ transport system protein B